MSFNTVVVALIVAAFFFFPVVIVSLVHIFQYVDNGKNLPKSKALGGSFLRR